MVLVAIGTRQTWWLSWRGSLHYLRQDPQYRVEARHIDLRLVDSDIHWVTDDCYEYW